MLKKLLLLLSCSSLCASDQTHETNPTLSTTQTILTIGGIGLVGTALVIVVAPLVLSAATIGAIKTTAITVTAKTTTAVVATKSSVIAAAPVIQKTATVVTGCKVGLWGGRKVKEYFDPTVEQKVEQLLREEALEKPFEEQLREAFEKNNNR